MKNTNRLLIVGDLHGEFGSLQDLHDIAGSTVSAIIQVGDFGYYSWTLNNLRKLKLDIPMYWIDGNHEDHDLLQSYTSITELHSNVFYVPRGTRITIAGYDIAFLGGAKSLDYEIRMKTGDPWSPLEMLSPSQYMHFYDQSTPDIFITHCPPASMRKLWMPHTPDFLKQFCAPPDWKDPTEDIVQSIWDNWNRPPLYCGHLHMNKKTDTCTIVDINGGVIHGPSIYDHSV